MERKENLESRIPSIFSVGLFRFISWIVLFVALLQRQQGLIILAVFLLLLVYGAKLWSKYSSIKLIGELNADKVKLFPNEQVIIKAKVENRKLLPVWIQVKIPLAGVQDVPNGNDLLVEESSLLWFEQVLWQWEAVAKRRGYHQLGPITAESGDLLGFFSHSHSFNKHLYLTIYPRILPVKRIAIQLREFYGKQTIKSLVEDPTAPMGVREYRYGRSARNIHWKASARQNNLQEKVFAPTAQLKVMLIADVNRFGDTNVKDEFERMVEIVASLAVELDKQGISVGLIVNGLVKQGSPIVPISKGSGQMTAILETLARLQVNSQGAMKDVLKKGLKLTGETSCIYFCHHLDTEANDAGNFLRYQCKMPVAYIVNQSANMTKIDNFKVYHLDHIVLEEARENV